MNGTTDPHLLEYEKLKEEQGRRIHFRDNMRYVTLAAIGVVAVQAGKSARELWLVIPWICVVLGWNYVANASTVYRIGKYLESTLRDTVSKSAAGDCAFQWETVWYSDEGYASRRVRQLVVDEVTFFFPGLIALVIFFLTESDSALLWPSALLLPIAGVELLLCAWIGRQIFDYAGGRATFRLKGLPSALVHAFLRRRHRTALDTARRTLLQRRNFLRQSSST